ncbi:6-pyruvoyl-tetrahydropterin synthase related protein [Lachnospiraceae bacterium KM106-2]|nr:6-pyruvoyl-tetrahydropterin synthase related protein [Lachnospiraceae bacterium KM106-2]
MKNEKYRFKFYLNASHAISINGFLGKSHPHTWEIAIDAIKLKESFIQFNQVEDKMESFLADYQDRFLNEIDPFTTINPTLENTCEYFMDEFSIRLNQLGWKLLAIEMSETPTRSYVIECDEMQIQEQTKEEKVENFLTFLKQLNEEK